jgi:hypothetical protein
MKTSDQPKLQTLREISIILSRFNHALRSPLGVIINSLNEEERGHKLVKDDYVDMRVSAQKINHILDLLKKFSKFNVTEFEPHDLFRLVKEKANEYKLNFSSPGRLVLGSEAQIDIVQISWALELIFAYGVCFKDTYLEPFQVEATAGEPLVGFDLCISNWNRRIPSNIIDFLQLDHTLEALGVALAAEVFKEHRGSVEFSQGRDEIFKILFRI